MLAKLSAPPTWRPKNSINILNLFWLFRRVIISTELTNINKSTTFSNTFTPKKAKNHQISAYFSTNAIGAVCHGPRGHNSALVCKPSTIELKGCKLIKIHISICLMRRITENFRGSLVLDIGIDDVT